MFRRILLFVTLALSFVPSAGAQGTKQTFFPGWAPTDATVRLQEKAEAALEAGEYRKAMWLYSKELTPLGDKYGQYMVGYMHEKGLSVPPDAVQAGAWYLLAAERGHEPIVAAANDLQSRLRPEQLAAAREMAVSLKAKWGDKTLVRQAIRRDIERLSSTTGTRIRSRGRRTCGSQQGRVFVDMTSISLERYCEAVNDRIERRIAYLEGYVTYGELELVPDALDEAAAEPPSPAE